MHPDEPGRTTGRAGGGRLALDDQDLRPAPGELEGQAGALDPGAHDDDVGGEVRGRGHALPARSASAPSWTSAVAAARSGPGSRSPSRWRTRSRTRAERLGDARPGRRAIRVRRAAGRAPARRTSSSIARIRLDVAEDRPGVPRRDRAHRHVVLLVRAGRDRVDRGRDAPGPCSPTRGRPPCTGRSSSPSRSRTRAARNGGSPPLRRGSTSSAVRRSLIEPSSARAIFAKSSASAIGSPWKLPPLMTRPPPVASVVLVGDAAAGEDERVVGRRVELDVEDAPQVVERVADRAVDLRDAAQRVRVLDLVGVAVMAGLQRRCRGAGGGARRRPRSGPGAAGRAGRPRRTRRRSRAAPRRSSPRRRSPSGRAGRRRRAASAPIAPIIWVPLSSARPSFASSVERLEPGLAQGDERRA